MPSHDDTRRTNADTGHAREDPHRGGVPRWVDVATVIAVFFYSLLVQGVPGAIESPLAVLVPLGLCLPYLWRRTRPLAAFLIILVVAFVQAAAGMGPLVADIMMVFALAGLAAREVPPRSLPAAGAATGWVVVMAVLHLDENALSIGDVALFLLMIVTAWVSGQLARTRRHYVAELQERAHRLERERETGMAMAAAEERARIAREIHDVVSHSLSAVTLLADGAASTVTHDPERARTAMLSVRDTGREAMGQMRQMLSVLRSQDEAGLTPQPGIADLHGLVRAVADAGTPVALTITGDPTGLPADLQLTVYRIVQESLTNVRKHAGRHVTDVTVEVDLTPEAPVRVSVVNTAATSSAGVDADPTGETAPPGGHGILGMQERAATHGGVLHAGPTADGYVVHAELPRRELS